MEMIAAIRKHGYAEDDLQAIYRESFRRPPEHQLGWFIDTIMHGDRPRHVKRPVDEVIEIHFINPATGLPA